ncbi:MAG: hypothetical protein K0R54_4970 [Clostridiaceae bacterium]|jgi:serine phosphatase RsbU (regulator of sigma subunit)|nr:hypothetical protein [Clostridiaceae bacterium]
MKNKQMAQGIYEQVIYEDIKEKLKPHSRNWMFLLATVGVIQRNVGETTL